MEASLGFEVGAEVELTEMVEECSSVMVENKQDLPVWQTVHCIDDLISDEEADTQPGFSQSADFESLKTFDSSFIDKKVRLEERIPPIETAAPLAAISTSAHTGYQNHLLSADAEPIFWNNCYVQEPESTMDVKPGEVEKVRISDETQSPGVYRLSSNFNHISPDVPWSEQEKHEDIEHFSYYNANTQFRGSVKPSVRRHKCPRCGRSFRRLCNLEKHLCLKMAMGFPVANGNNVGQTVPSVKASKEVNRQERNLQSSSGSVETLEQMCAQAQQELHYIQQQHCKAGPLHEDRLKPGYKAVQKVNASGHSSSPDSFYTPEFPLFFPCKECGRYIHKNSLDGHSCWNKDPDFPLLESVDACYDSETTSPTSPLVPSHCIKNMRPLHATLKPANAQRSSTRRKKVPCVEGADPTKETFSRMLPFLCEKCGRGFRRKHTLEKHKCSNRDPGTSVLQRSAEPPQPVTTTQLAGHPYPAQRRKVRKGKRSKMPEDDSICKKVDFLSDPSSFEFAESSMDFVIRTVDDSMLYDEDEMPIEFIDSDMAKGLGDIHDENVDEVSQHLLSGRGWGSLSPARTKRSIPRPLTLPRKTLTRIMRRGKLSHRCQDCGAQFLQYSQWKRHQQKAKEHKSRTKNYKCDCGRKIIGPLHLLRHQLQHIIDTPFVCSVCGQCLLGYRRLRAHSWVHPSASRFQCDCGAMFTHLSRYLWHSFLNRRACKGRETKAFHPKRPAEPAH